MSLALSPDEFRSIGSRALEARNAEVLEAARAMRG